jgi:hypothetical protein
MLRPIPVSVTSGVCRVTRCIVCGRGAWQSSLGSSPQRVKALLRILAIAALAISVWPTSAPAQIPFSSGPYSQDFNTLTIDPFPINWFDNSTLPGWYASHFPASAPFNTYVADDGNDTTGGLYSYGAPSFPERALGTLGSDFNADSAYGIRFTNNTSRVISNITVSYTGEQWRNGGNPTAQILAFSYRSSAAPITNPESGSTNNWTSVPALDFGTPTFNAAAGALDGNSVSNSTRFQGVVVSGLVVMPGEELFLRWRDINDQGNDHAVAIDDLMISFAAGPPVIVAHPQPKNVPLGSDVVFTVTATQATFGPITFQWKRNGVNIPGAVTTLFGFNATDNFLVPTVQPQDAGMYSVVVYNSGGAVDSLPAVLLINNIPALPVGDAFAQGGQLSGFGGVGQSANFTATKEAGEPNHGGKPGGASVWLKWIAPDTGIVNFGTRGSGFDTTIGIYTGSSIGNLIPVNGDDDEAGYLNSSVTFNAIAGTQYAIAIDGFYGDRGNIIVRWQLEKTPDQVPEILTQPQSQTVPLGQFIQLSVVIKSNAPAYLFQWFFNGDQISGQNQPTLVIPGAEPRLVGSYRVQITGPGNPPRSTLSDVAHIQVNLESSGSNPKTQAQPKFREGTDPFSGPSGIPRPGPPRAAPASGFTGTQMFNTYGAVKEPGEPNHCGEAGGASYWFSYLAPASGQLSVNTLGTGFNNVLAIYTGSPTNFPGLVSVACSSTNSGNGNEAVLFPASIGTNYYIVVDGVGGATGLVILNYSLGAPPIITNQPSSQTVNFGSNATFSVGATGTPVLSYQWRFNTTNILAGQTGTFLTVTNAQSTNAGEYTVVVTNSYGAATSTVATLSLNTPPSITTQPTNQTVISGNSVSFIAAATGTAPLRYQWRFNTTNNIPGETNSSYVLINAQPTNAGNYSVRVTNSFGSVTSATATLTVQMVSPSITNQPQSQTVAQGSNVTLTVGATGSAPLAYQWRTNSGILANRTNASLTLTNFQMADEGSYDVVVTNSAGGATSTPALLYLVFSNAARFTNFVFTNNTFFSLLLGAPNTNYLVQTSTNLGQTNWTSLQTSSAPSGIMSVTETNSTGHSNRFFRARSL